jgi:L-rhamnose isomerase
MLRQEEESLKLTELYLSYWEELVDQKSSIPKLQMILKKIKQSRADLESIVDSALKIFHNHVRVLLLYKNLLKEVANDYLGSIRCEERYKIGLK